MSMRARYDAASRALEAGRCQEALRLFEAIHADVQGDEFTDQQRAAVVEAIIVAELCLETDDEPAVPWDATLPAPVQRGAITPVDYVFAPAFPWPTVGVVAGAAAIVAGVGFWLWRTR